MQDPFKTVEPAKLDLKLGIFGSYKVGKTVLALSAANDEFGKVAVMDLEGGTKAYEGIYDFRRLPSKSYMDLIEALNFLETEKHDYKTLVIDPATMVWEAIQEARAKMKKSQPVEGKFADFHGLDWVDMKAINRQIMGRIVNLEMNVVMVFREKDETIYKGGQGTKTGEVVPEAEKSAPHFLDVYGRLIKDDKGNRLFELRGGRYIELENKTIKLPAFKDHVENHGFKKIYDLCGLSKRNQMAAVTGGVKLDINAADKDSEALDTGDDKRAVSAAGNSKPKPLTRRESQKQFLVTVSSDIRKAIWDNFDIPEGVATPSHLNDVGYTKFYNLCKKASEVQK